MGERGEGREEGRPAGAGRPCRRRRRCLEEEKEPGEQRRGGGHCCCPRRHRRAKRAANAVVAKRGRKDDGAISPSGPCISPPGEAANIAVTGAESEREHFPWRKGRRCRAARSLRRRRAPCRRG
ncbi:uncharacterized protein DS421_12g361240 [Arachis hypogaea]|nr:uncharacterized protein DS421_12g361240 [Arachis hypogaea]